MAHPTKCVRALPPGTTLLAMSDVASRPRGGPRTSGTSANGKVELFAPEPRRLPLKVTGKRAAGLAKLGISSVQDLLQHYPRYHVDRSQLRTIEELKEAGATEGEVQVHAELLRISRPARTRKGKLLIRGRIGDETGVIDVTWFNQDWVARALKPGMWAFFYGRLSEFRGKLQMTAPRFEVVRSGREPFNVGRIVPVYPATAELSSDQLRRLIWDALQGIRQGLLDPLPEPLRRELRVMGREDAVRLIHFPESKEDVLGARRRLVLDELLTLQLGLVYRKRKLERTVEGIPHPPPQADSLAESFVSELPFRLTSAQRRACAEVASDMSQSYPMHRLLEGEVGSGKTVVALYASLVAIEGGYQAAFMAPTEVLAEQHHLTVGELLDRAFGSAESRNLFAAASRRPVVRLLTGSTPAGARSEILRQVAGGEVDLLIGTHALIEDAVDFARLGLAVVDEQHRFGVRQRKTLRAKGLSGEPDILVMTATPIPRTLAVSVYGDLDLSVLDELPAGRRPIRTKMAAGEGGRDEAYRIIREQVEAGRQAYVVYALRDFSDKIELRSAKAEARRLAEKVFPDLAVGLVHGDMKAEDKEAAMAAFRDGRIDVLVATTVIEVGVDVPNATVMLIEDAHRFGLSQLHQLRGRVGRGEHPSICLLATDLTSEEEGEERTVALERLQAVERTRDGFELAEIDLEHRGEGELFGTRQSGLPQLKLASVVRHREEIAAARALAARILDEDPDLAAYEHRWLEREMRGRFPEAMLDLVQSG
jgi:ATP-dependent DNA helicase RecG